MDSVFVESIVLMNSVSNLQMGRLEMKCVKSIMLKPWTIEWMRTENPQKVFSFGLVCFLSHWALLCVLPVLFFVDL